MKEKVIIIFILLCSCILSCEEGFKNPIAEATRSNGSDNDSTTLLPMMEYLENPHPNPLSRSVNEYLTITFGIIHQKVVNLAIENAVGDVVCILLNCELSGGYFIVDWDTKNNNDKLVKTGIYFVHLTTSTGTSQKRLIEIRD